LPTVLAMEAIPKITASARMDRYEILLLDA
jgi:hypothetical protein